MESLELICLSFAVICISLFNAYFLCIYFVYCVFIYRRVEMATFLLPLKCFTETDVCGTVGLAIKCVCVYVDT